MEKKTYQYSLNILVHLNIFVHDIIEQFIEKLLKYF